MPDSSDRLLRDDIHLLQPARQTLKAQEGQQLFQAALNQIAVGVIETEMRACVNSCMPGDADDRRGRVAKALATVLKSSWEYPSDAHALCPARSSGYSIGRVPIRFLMKSGIMIRASSSAQTMARRLRASPSVIVPLTRESAQ